MLILKNTFVLLQDHRKALYNHFIKIARNFDVILSYQICFKFGIQTLYIPLSNVYKFHQNQTGSSREMGT